MCKYLSNLVGYLGLTAVAISAVLLSPCCFADEGSSLGRLDTVKTIASTVPSNGDLNPYGVAVVRHSSGRLTRGDVLVSNFNGAANQQGTGTTIVDIAPNGQHSVFAEIDPSTLPGPCPGGVGLTTALAVLPHGWVIVGSLPTTDGTAQTAQAGCLIILDHDGHVVETVSGTLINGPWDLTAVDRTNDTALFVTNVLNGTVQGNGNVVHKGTVVRIVLEFAKGEPPTVESMTVVGSGFAERTDPAAIVIGPTGVGFGRDGTLYVADSLENRIAALPDALDRRDSAGTGATVSKGGSLNDPLGLAIAPSGDIVTVNGDDGFLVVTTPDGEQVAQRLLDSTGSLPGAGALFGLAVVPDTGVYFVDDNTNTLNLLY